MSLDWIENGVHREFEETRAGYFTCCDSTPVLTEKEKKLLRCLAVCLINTFWAKFLDFEINFSNNSCGLAVAKPKEFLENLAKI